MANARKSFWKGRSEIRAAFLLRFSMTGETMQSLIHFE